MPHEQSEWAMKKKLFNIDNMRGLVSRRCDMFTLNIKSSHSLVQKKGDQLRRANYKLFQNPFP
ncbi:MAG: hypothetical protein DRH17_08700 [Deltaproteobacteria bacterium]|nr:MAG: hypothetical protein DRH17_08700 [Deltaproteobacteria bacterium]